MSYIQMKEIETDHVKLLWLNYLADIVKTDERKDIEELLDSYFVGDINIRDLNQQIIEYGYKSLVKYKKDIINNEHK